MSWENIEAGLRAFFGWVFRHPIIATIIAVCIAVVVIPNQLEALIIGVLTGLIDRVLLPLVPLGLVVWAILWILGYGRLWGKRKKKD